MMSLPEIQRQNAEAAMEAAERDLVPYIVEDTDITAFEEGWPFPFPNLGDHRPKGWKLNRSLFCDSSGLGSPYEPALTPSQLVDELVTGRGYAIIEEGQFQLYVGEFTKEDNPNA